MNKNIWITLILIIIATTTVLAAQPQQTTNKILLSPFHVTSMTQLLNYTYNVSVITPDGISEVKTAILTFDAWINPTRTFNAWMNNVQCNTKNYTISTTYASAGRGVITFDCTNAILPNQINTVRFVVTGGNIGGSTAWLDLTYMNNPIGDMEVSGTEYSPGDPATVFVQLTDSYDHAVSNGSCYLNIWYPANASNVHPYTTQNAPMLPALGNEGMYYYDLVAPSQLGVYMLSARCNYAYNWNWIYEPTDVTNFPIRTVTSGTFVGDSASLNSKTDSLYERCTNAAATTCDSYYIFNISSYGPLSNITNINVYYSGQSDVATRTLTMSYWNGTAYVNLANTLTYAATGATATVAGPIDQFLTNSVPLASIMVNGTIRIKLTTNTGLARFYNNWLTLAILNNAGTVQEVKGNSEMHITNIPNASLSLITTNLPAQVWNHTTRNLTYYNMTDTTNYTLVQNNVWNATDRNLTYYAPVTINTSAIVEAVWNYTTRNLSYYPAQIDLTNYTLMQIYTWNSSARYTHGVILN